MRPVLSIAVGLGLLAGAGAAWAAPSPPDLTGVWTNPGAPRIGGGEARGTPPPLPLKPEAKAKIEAYQKLVAPGGETPGMYCLGSGMPGSMLFSGGYPMEIIQRPDQITILYEAHTELRHVYFGARNAPPEDRIPGRNGYSTGHWEGDTLVVETDNLVEQVDQRFAHSDDARIVERYHLDPPDEQGRRVLSVEMTLTDPAFYTEPVKTTKKWAQVPNGRLLPYECPEETWRKRLEALAKGGAPPPPR